MNDSMLARVNVVLLKLVAQAYLDGKITRQEMGEIAQVMGGLIDVYIEACKLVAAATVKDNETIN